MKNKEFSDITKFGYNKDHKIISCRGNLCRLQEIKLMTKEIRSKGISLNVTVH